jgi:hypothetical protein
MRAGRSGNWDTIPTIQNVRPRWDPQQAGFRDETEAGPQCSTVPWQARCPPAGWLATKSMAGAGVVARDHRVKFAVCRAIKRLYRAEIRLTLP